MDLTIFQQLFLGIIQGIFEWLPISSSGFTALAMTNLFHVTDINLILRYSLFLHLGTFFAALIYFRREVADLFVSMFHYKSSDIETKKTLKFLIITTIISGIIGLIILKLLENYEDKLTGIIITLFIGVLLLITGILQISIKNSGLKKEKEIKNSDSILLGFTQGISFLPGLSRSGTTVSVLLLRKFKGESALRLSFLMSLPVVLFANIFLNISNFSFSGYPLYGLYGVIASFIFGIITIYGLMRLSKKVNFGWLLVIFAILMIVSIIF